MKKIFSIILTFSFVFMPNVNFCVASKSVLATRVQKSEINQSTIKDELPKKVSTATNKKMSALKSVLATRVQKSEINQSTIKDELPKKVSTATNKKMSALKIGEIMTQLSMSAIFGVSMSLMASSGESLYKKIGKFVNKFAELTNKNKKYESILKVQKDIKDKKKEKLTLIEQNFNKANNLLNFQKALKSINIDLQESINKRSDRYYVDVRLALGEIAYVFFIKLMSLLFR